MNPNQETITPVKLRSYARTVDGSNEEEKVETVLEEPVVPRSISVLNTASSFKNTKSGLRPFVEASYQLFHYLKSEFEKLILQKNNRFYQLILDHGKIFSVEFEDSSVKKFRLHELLYGSQVDSKNFYERVSHHNKYHIINPFLALQIYFRTQNMFLGNYSDPSKSFKLQLRLYTTRPTTSGVLWHKQDLIPYFFEDTISLDSPRLKSSQFYLAPTLELARELVNATFQQKIEPIVQNEPTVQIEPTVQVDPSFPVITKEMMCGGC